MEIGRVNSLEILKTVDFGIYLDSGDGVEILMPRRYVPKDAEIGQFIDAFIYRDSEDRLIATTVKPLVMVGECALLKVKAVSKIGAFLDWGLPKDLLVPFNQMAVRLKEGDSCVVYVYADDRTGRIAGSSRLSLFLKETGAGFHIGQQVSLLIASKSDLGVKAVINGTHLGLIFHAEIDQPVSIGDRIKGFIKRVRTEDERIDLALDARRAMTRGDISSEILKYIDQNDGVMTLNDKSSPAEIQDAFGVSKGAFKKALGSLYKDQKIVIEPEKITLAKVKAKSRKKLSQKKSAGKSATTENTVDPGKKRKQPKKPDMNKPERKPEFSGKAAANKPAKQPRVKKKPVEEVVDTPEVIPADSPWAKGARKATKSE